MNRLLRGITVVAGCVFLIGCGGQEEDSALAAQPASVTKAKTTRQPANNPLASQQQLLRDAKGVQSILDKDAERRKKALSTAD